MVDPVTDTPPPDYPHELTEVALLDDGTPVEFRAILPADAARLERLFHRLSPQSLYLRFFAPVPRPQPAMIRRLVDVDYTDRLAIVAVVDDEIIGVARYDRLAAVVPSAMSVDPGEAEAAVIVEDAWQGRGIATRLLWRLSAAGAARGLHTFTASVLAQNKPMLGLLRVIGSDVEVVPAGGEYEVRMRLAGVLGGGEVTPPDRPGGAAGGAPRA
jgi:RimJ/RimL family protein N-acetyltransferase